MFWVVICTVHLKEYSCHVYSCPNVKELLVWRRREILNLIYCTWNRTQNDLGRKRLLNHLTKLTKWLSCVLSTYLYSEYNCISLSCHLRISELIHTLYLPEYQGTPCWKQVRNLKIKWLELDSNQEPHSSEMNTEPFGQTGQMIELFSEYLSVRCIWLYLLIM